MITVIKAFKMNDPGTKYIKWVEPPKLTEIAEMNESIKDIEFNYNSGIRTTFKYVPSDRTLDIVIDETSDFKQTQYIMREIYEFALEDVAEMMNTSKEYLACSLRDYYNRKRMI